MEKDKFSSRATRMGTHLLLACLPVIAGSAGVASAGKITVGQAELVRIETPHPYPSGRAGEAAWRYLVHWPQASYLALHFESFDLAPGDEVVISDPAGVRRVVYTGKGKDNRGTFWATHIPGEDAVIELRTTSATPAAGFVIDKVAVGFPHALDGGEAICGTDDSRWARCYQTSEPGVYDHGRPVMRLLIQGSGLCTAWLIGSEGHVITNQHCIEDAADAADTDFELMAESSCTTDCPQLACPGVVVASSATLVLQSDRCDLDYSLVKLAVDPTPSYGYLTLDPFGTDEEEQIYIIGHPQGWGKRTSFASTDPTDASGKCEVRTMTADRCDPTSTCGGVLGGSREVGYMCDTQGGSSGSPVLRYNDHRVVALHHCADCPNRGEHVQDLIEDLGSDLPISALATGDKLAAAVAACDFNGDGYDDLALGVPDEDIGSVEDAGMVNVLYGSASGLQVSSPDDQIWYQDSANVEGGSETNDRFGAALAAGDFNHDGYCDLAIGVPGEDNGSEQEAGYVNVLYGSASGLQTTTPADQGWNQDSTNVEDSTEPGDAFGSALAAGDFNGDGYDDLAIGVPGESVGSAEDAGYVNILYGGASRLQTTAPADQGLSQNSSIGGFAIEGGSEANDHMGASLAAGDFNNDGFDDLAIGAPDEDIGSIVDAGHVNVIYGGAAGLQASSPADQSLYQDASIGRSAIEGSSEAYDHFGKALAAGDFNGDGRDDLAIGVPEDDVSGAIDAGLVNVIYGGAAGLQASAPADQVWHQDSANVDGMAERGDGFGSALAVGDFDNDGRDDLAIGSPEDDVSGDADAGLVAVLYGAAAGLQATGPEDDLWTQDVAGVEGSCERGDHFGRALAAGDFDNNGKDDLAIGVPEEDISSVIDAGYVNVIYGAVGGLQVTAPPDDGWYQNSSGVKDVCE